MALLNLVTDLIGTGTIGSRSNSINTVVKQTLLSVVHFIIYF